MHNEYVANLTVSQFKKFRAAFRVLKAAGISDADAVEILVNAHVESYRRRIA